MNNDPAQLDRRSSAKSVPSPSQTLRTLFLTMFLRGRSARGLQVKKAPKTVGQKLAWVLLLYTLFGLMAFGFRGQTIFLLSAYLHAMTFIFLGMFIASSAGEILFNREEADILLHRPIDSRALLWAKVRVLTEVSLWLAVAINLVGLFIGVTAPDGGWLFPLVHLISLCLEALFCTGCVVMVYQLCLRWFGRDRLEGVMTMAQVLISVTAVLGGQIVPHVVMNMENVGITATTSWWPVLLPPAWFAGLDDALVGSRAGRSWVYAALALVSTLTVLWISFGKLAQDYQSGLQTLNETVSSRKKTNSTRGLLHQLVDMPPLRWWLHDPVERASFLLTAAYLIRDRDVKLRLYPGIAPLLIFPAIMLLQGFRNGADQAGGFSFSVAFGYTGLVPLMALSMLQYSQDWQAADIFRAAPIAGPAPLCHGARRAVLLFTTLPLLLVLAVTMGFARGDNSQWLLVIPPMIALPIYALVPNLNGRAVPLSQAVEEAKSAGRGLSMMGTIFISMILAALSSWAWNDGWLWQLIVAESVVVIILYVVMTRSIKNSRWSSLE